MARTKAVLGTVAAVAPYGRQTIRQGLFLLKLSSSRTAGSMNFYIKSKTKANNTAALLNIAGWQREVQSDGEQ